MPSIRTSAPDGVLSTWTGALPSAPVSIVVVGGSQSDSGADNPTRLPPARIQAAAAAKLIVTTPSRTAISQRGVSTRARRRRGGRHRWVCGRERNGRRCSWVTSDTDGHLREECPQPDDGAFRRCAEGVSMLLPTAGHASRRLWRRSEGVSKVCLHTAGRSRCRPHRDGQGLACGGAMEHARTSAHGPPRYSCSATGAGRGQQKRRSRPRAGASGSKASRNRRFIRRPDAPYAHIWRANSSAGHR
jgi:hypothetical protein